MLASLRAIGFLSWFLFTVESRDKLNLKEIYDKQFNQFDLNQDGT